MNTSFADRLNSPSWHTQSVEAVLQTLSSQPAGLTASEARHRLSEYGPNELKEAKPISPWKIFLGQFKSLIVWILIVAGMVSGLLGEVVDSLAILAIVVLNAVIGFYQEFSAEKSIAALKKMTAPQAKVRRAGRTLHIPASEMVVGDVIELEAGDLVAADARLLEASALKCVESALTGESEAADKQAFTLRGDNIPLGDRENMVFMGTSVAAGTGLAVVVATGMNTEIGRIAGLIEQASTEETTPLQQKLASFGRVLVWGSLSVVMMLFFLGLLRGMKFFELFMTSVSLAVAAVPEGLPAAVTVALALGVLRMSRRRALVRRLPSVETLGSTTVICTDKTGTLTVGEMTVRSLWVAGKSYEVTGEGYEPRGQILTGGITPDPAQLADLRELFTIMVGCNNAHIVQDAGQWKAVGDPTEGAMLTAAAKLGIAPERVETRAARLREIPFDSDRKRRTVIRRVTSGSPRAMVNGAPDVLLELCTHVYTTQGIRAMTEQDRQAILEQNGELTRRSLRVLASAYRDLNEADLSAKPEDIERNLVFVGLAGMQDPPRPEVKDAVAKSHAAGIRVVMITGDHPHTATAIARELGIATSNDLTISGIELDKMDDERLRQVAANTAIYARVTSEHKLRIVRAWKANGAVVAMTGDGVNDAPAIKGADIGIAMGRTGTEVTKQASDMVITDDNFASIVAAVEEGRGIYDNIRKTLQYLLSGNAGELLLMTACVVAGLPTPLLPIHLLWINLVTDGLPALCLATDPIDPDVMKRQPRPRTERITDSAFGGAMLLTGFLTALVSFVVYLYGLKTETQELARTHAFAVLVFAELLRSLGCRSETKPVWRIPLHSNINLTVVIAASLGLQVWSHHNETLGRFLKTSSIPVWDCGMLLGISAVPLVILEAVKYFRNAIPKPNASGLTSY